MATQATDSFSRANTGTTGFLWGNASDGQAWAQIAGTSNASILSNKGRVTGVSTAFNTFFLGSKKFYSLDLKVNITKSSAADVAGLVVRGQSTTAYYRAEFSNGGLSIQLFQNSTTTQLGTTFSFTENAATSYTLRFLLQGFGTPNSPITWNLQAKVWATSGSEPGTWGVQTNNSALTNPGQFGLRAKLNNIADTIDFDTFTAVDPTSAPPVPAYNVLRELPYGQTLSVPAGNSPPLLAQQVLTDLLGWDNGAWLRYTLQWAAIEQTLGVYFFDVLDDAVARANIAGVNMCFSLTSAPSFRQTIDGFGNNCTLQTALTAGVPVTSLTVSALVPGTYIPHGAVLAVDSGGAHPENVTINNPGGTYTAGATALTINSFTPSFNHSVGAQIYEANNGAALPSAADMATFAGLIAARYNGAGPYGKIARLQIENEAYDAATRIGAQTVAWDNGGAILAPVYAAAYTAIKAVHPTCVVMACSVRKTPLTCLTHYQNWIGGLCKNVTALDALDTHYYRDGVVDWNGTPVTDPTQNTYTDGTHATINTPNIALALATIKSAAAQYGLYPQVGCWEFGWQIFDDGNGFTATTNATYTAAGGPYTSISTGAGLSSNIPNATPIYIDWQAPTKTEVVYAYGAAAPGATTIQITTNPAGNSQTQAGWTPLVTHASVALYAANSAGQVTTWVNDAKYSQSMYDACRATGSTHCARFTMASTSVVTTGIYPEQAGSQRSWTQTIDGQYRYLPGYHVARLYATLWETRFWIQQPARSLPLTADAGNLPLVAGNVPAMLPLSSPVP